MKKGGAHPVLPGLRILFDETNGEQRAQDAVDGPFGQAELSRQLGEAQPAGASGEQPENG